MCERLQVGKIKLPTSYINGGNSVQLSLAVVSSATAHNGCRFKFGFGSGFGTGSEPIMGGSTQVHNPDLL